MRSQDKEGRSNQTGVEQDEVERTKKIKEEEHRTKQGSAGNRATERSREDCNTNTHQRDNDQEVKDKKDYTDRKTREKASEHALRKPTT